MKYAAIHALFRERCPQAELTLGDFEFVMPTLEWVAGDFLRSWREKCIADDLVYIPGKRDCENFAELCAAHAKECHARTSGNIGRGILFGSFWYQDETIGPHGIDCFITHNDEHEPDLFFIEPQPAARLQFLSENEIRSCTKALFS